MEEAFQAILDSLPPKAGRSKLEPYAELIRELRKRGRSYREIASILAERCGVCVGTHTVYNFVQVRSKAKKISAGQRERAAPFASSPVPDEIEARAPHEGIAAAHTPGVEKFQNPDETRRKMEAIKQRSLTPMPYKKSFEYNPEEPLRLLPHSSKKSE